MKKKILISFGTRPEAIKLVKIIKLLKKYSKIDLKICVSGQHNQLLYQVLDLFKIKPDFDLKVMKSNQSLNLLSSKILKKMNNILQKYKPNLIIVHGDTTTAFITALAAFQNKIKIAHVEAGLRTNNIKFPYPEEFNRKSLGILADFNYTPSKQATKNLIDEKISKKKIIQTGNTVVDTLKESLNLLVGNKILINKIKKKFFFLKNNKNLIIVTCHRRENYGNGIENICSALKEIVKKYNNLQIVFPVHPNPNIRKKVFKMLKKVKNIYLTKPLDYFSFVYLMKESKLILTDSGGIQEEAPTFKKPVLILRNETERPEVKYLGGAVIVGTNKKKIITTVMKLISNKKAYKAMTKITNPFGKGQASKKIVNHLLNNI